MKKASVFVDRQAQQSMEVWYERFASRLPYPTRSIRVETDFGWTEVIDTLPESNQDPVLLLHGAMSGAPFALGEILAMLVEGDYRPSAGCIAIGIEHRRAFIGASLMPKNLVRDKTVHA